MFYSDEFSQRHNSISEDDQKKMLSEIGAKSMDELINLTIPDSIRLKSELNLDPAQTETQFLKSFKDLVGKNKKYKSYIGMGYYDCITPNVIKRNILENPGWYTAYTPYQPEVSQGRLEMLINFQQLIMDLTGMEIANASLLDESTAAAEAMTMCMKLNKDKRLDFLVDVNCYPQTIDVLKTRAKPHGINVVIGNPWEDIKTNDKIYALLVQYPNIRGEILDLKDLIKRANIRSMI